MATGAIYAPANFLPLHVGPEVEFLARTDDNTPMRPVYFPGSPYRATGTKLSWLKETRVPDGFLVGDITLQPYSTPNNCSALIHFPSGDIVQLEPTTRLQPTGPIWGFPLIGENIYGEGEKGSHYGAGLSALGGSIRPGELTGTEPIRHALKLLLQASKYLYRGVPDGPGPKGFGFHWPAICCDGDAHNPPEKDGYGGTDPNIAQGSLIALDPKLDLATLHLSDPRAIKIAEALRDYGAYIVDDTAWPNYALGVNSEAVPEFNAIPQDELQRVIAACSVVTNTSPSAKKGPGAPRVSLLPELAPPGKE